MTISESEKKRILSLYYKNESDSSKSENRLGTSYNILMEQMTVYYYDSTGKFAENNQNKIPQGGVDVKYVFPNDNDPYEKKYFPSTVDANLLRIAGDTQRTAQQLQTQKNYDNQAGQGIQKGIEAAYQINAACKSNPKSDYVLLKQGGYQYLCHTNYCNNHKDERYDPENVLCKNNTLLAKIKESGWDGFFNKLREAMNSYVGVGAQVLLDSTGLGGILVEVAWGLLLAWDVYQMNNGKTDWINILTDLAGVITFGPGAKILGTAFKNAKLTSGAYESVLAFVKAKPKMFNFLAKANFSSLFESMVVKLGELAVKFDVLAPVIKGISTLLTSVSVFVKAVKKALTKAGGDAIYYGVNQSLDNVVNGSSGKTLKTVSKASSLIKSAAEFGNL